jgi:hypothetical protein
MTKATRVHSTPPLNSSVIDNPQSTSPTLHRYLEPSPILADGGAQVGKLPGSIPLHDLLDLGHPESPIKLSGQSASIAPAATMLKSASVWRPAAHSGRSAWASTLPLTCKHRPKHSAAAT